jgi:hypothetical protein
VASNYKAPIVGVGPGSAGSPVPVSIQADPDLLKALEARLAGIKNGMRDATRTAINNSLRSGRAEVVRGIYTAVTVKRSNIRRGTGIDPARRGDPNPAGRIKVLGREIGLINFEHREKPDETGWGTSASGEGVFYKVYRDDEQEQLRHAFVATGNNDNEHIFEREIRGGAVGTREGRFPLKRHQGVSLLDVYEDRPQLQANAVARIRELFATNLTRKVEFLIKKRKAPTT